MRRVILLFLLFSHFTYAESLSEMRQKLLFQTKTLNEFQKLSNKISEHEILEKDCRWEMEAQQLPLACYQLQKVGNYKSEVNLDENCRKWVMKIYNLQVLMNFRGSTEVSKTCIEHIEQQIAKASYIQKWQTNCCIP